MSKVLMYQGQPGTSSAAAVLASSSVRAVDAATVVNPTASSAWISVWIVQSGDSAADDTILYHEKAISAGSTEVLSALLNQCIPANATVHLQAETNSALTVTISGQQR